MEGSEGTGWGGGGGEPMVVEWRWEGDRGRWEMDCGGWERGSVMGI